MSTCHVDMYVQHTFFCFRRPLVYAFLAAPFPLALHPRRVWFENLGLARGWPSVDSDWKGPRRAVLWVMDLTFGGIARLVDGNHRKYSGAVADIFKKQFMKKRLDCSKPFLLSMGSEMLKQRRVSARARVPCAAAWRHASCNKWLQGAGNEGKQVAIHEMTAHARKVRGNGRGFEILRWFLF